MKSLSFKTKAETLNLVASHLKQAKVAPQYCFTVGDFKKNSSVHLEQIRNFSASLNTARIIVRSSALAEDANHQSLAGYFESILNINPYDLDELNQAIQKVIESYAVAENDLNQVFIQPMIQNVCASGVLFTADPNTQTPYFVLNYAENSDTTAITAGQSNQVKTVFIYPYSSILPTVQLHNQLIQLAVELQLLFSTQLLDIEFAYTERQELYLLQVRPLILRDSNKTFDLKQQNVLLNQIANKIRSANRVHPHLHGSKTVYGVMPDWNPAEIIGIRPKALALSLYKELITDAIWAYQRNNYGYKNLRSFPLLVDFFGLPYIDVRVSFNSFIPDEISSSLSDRLVNYYINKLSNTPALHDKVEFDIIFSCYTLDLPERIQILSNYGFNSEDIQQLTDALRQLTNNIIGKNGIWRQDRERLIELQERHQKVLYSDLELVDKIYWLLEDCKRYGTLPFAGLARAGFIAVQMLKSLVTKEVLSQENYNAFISSLESVSTQMGRDFVSLDQSTFLAKYGHLRPGTYDITSPRYDEAPNDYFDWSSKSMQHIDSKLDFGLSLTQMRKISDLLAEHQLEHDIVGFFDFLQGAIEGREYAKFLFTKNLSDALSLLKELGLQYGFDQHEIAYLDIQTIYQLYSNSLSPKELIVMSIEEGKRRYEKTQQIILPPLICNESDVFYFTMPECLPNFITQKQVTASITDHHNKDNLKNKIVMIPSADPGFDWLFSHEIAGFITAYGGVNSHMAIRAGELNLPAIIGAGEVLYQKWSKAKILKIDCQNRKVDIIQ